VSLEAFTNVAACPIPLYVTVDVETKFVPLMVSVCAAAPAFAEDGDRVVIAGTRLFTVNVAAVDGPPPGKGFVTTTGNNPPVAWSPVVNWMVNCPAFTNVAACATELYVTVEVETKFVPFIVRVCAAAPAFAEFGERLLIVGTRLFTVKFVAADEPPPGAGFVTITGNVPPVAWSPKLNWIVNCPAFTNVAACPTALYVTVDVKTKFVPLILSVCAAAPAFAEFGERLVIVGAGLFTVKFVAVDEPPPGAGFVTITGNSPAVA